MKSCHVQWVGCAFFALFVARAANGAQTPSAGQAFQARQVAAPASDIESGVVRLPQLGEHATVSSAAIFELKFERVAAALWTADFAVPIERSGDLALMLLSSSANQMRLLAAPAGSPLQPIDQSHAVERRRGMAGDGLPGWIADRRDVRGVAAGRWNVRVESDQAPTSDAGFLLVSSSSDLSARAFVTTHSTLIGEPMFVAARLSGAELATTNSARIVFESDASSRELRMFDDGQHDDQLAGDGVFAVAVPDDIGGRVRARIDLFGTTRAGRMCQRTAPLTFVVLAPRVKLNGAVIARELGSNKLEIALVGVPSGSQQRLHVSAEVWGRSIDGTDAPVCWLSRQLEWRDVGQTVEMPLEFDMSWLDASGLGTPLHLRNVRVQDPDTEVVFDAAELLPLELGFQRASGISQPTATLLPTFGANAMQSQAGATPVGPLGEVLEVPFTPALMLVHGYCSSGSIWPAADFSAPKLEFLDPNANRTHDQFAQLIAQKAATAGLSSFGIVGHSQGGPAALHLLTYYTSGLDRSTGARRIQSVASPYLGTPLASLGSFACGVNNNMTPSGAATWLAGIPTWARAQVFTFTTANSGSACNFFTGLILNDPEDGTVEKVRAELPGGNNLGHTIGWCHTTGMSNPASYTDHTRNQAMDAAAAR